MKTREMQTKVDYTWLSLINDSLLSLLLQPATYTLNYILIIMLYKIIYQLSTYLWDFHFYTYLFLL